MQKTAVARQSAIPSELLPPSEPRGLFGAAYQHASRALDEIEQARDLVHQLHNPPLGLEPYAKLAEDAAKLLREALRNLGAVELAGRGGPRTGGVPR